MAVQLCLCCWYLWYHPGRSQVVQFSTVVKPTPRFAPGVGRVGGRGTIGRPGSGVRYVGGRGMTPVGAGGGQLVNNMIIQPVYIISYQLCLLYSLYDTRIPIDIIVTKISKRKLLPTPAALQQLVN